MKLTCWLPLLCAALIFGCKSKDDDVAPLPEVPVVEEPAVTPDLTIQPVTELEGDTPKTFDFLLRLSSQSKDSVTVDYFTTDRTAIGGEDFVPASGTLLFLPGEVEQLLRIDILADTIKEADEVFELHLHNAVNANLLDSMTFGTLLNDDSFVPLPNDGYVSPMSYPGYELVWEENFSGSQINPDHWTHETGNHGWGNNEWQNYTARPENSYLYGGNLIIEARKENFGGSQYTSARMISAGKQEFQYGRIDVRARLPEGQGIWPAIWMLGNNIWSDGWPACGEIDIMELIGHQPSTTHGTIHWSENGSHASYGGETSLNSGKFSDEYHVFSIIWDEAAIRWLLDDVEFHVAYIQQPSLSEFHNEFFFILNIAVGGNWPGYPNASTSFPQRMYVDYIRVFQE